MIFLQIQFYNNFDQTSFSQMIEMAVQPDLTSQGAEKNLLPSYPSINIYSSSRVFNQRVNNSKLPLLKYRQAIRANNCTKSNDADTVDSSSLRKIMEKDGLIYSVKNMVRSDAETRSIIRMKALICICMYNQSKNAINLTLEGIYNNLPALRQKGIAPGDIAVVLVQDGILKLVQDRVKKTYVKGKNSMIEFYKRMDRVEGKHKCDLTDRISTILNQIQNYDRKGMSSHVQRNRDFPPSIEKNISLVYQNLWYPDKTNFQIDQRNIKVPDANNCLRLFSCFKHTNGTKLSSHLLFFQGFCRYLKPQFCVLLDVGTTPQKQGLANLLNGFSLGVNIGGVTGFMNVDRNFKSQQGQDSGEGKSNCCKDFFFSIERAQQYQYTISHFLDKNQQSALGFLHVLPGAWSAYRYDALIKSEKYEPNLLERSYFKMILNPDLQQKDYQQANMYLAQDRILSLGIYCQMDEKYTLKYIPDARAFTDPMKDHENLMNQRRRWINSSLFAFLYVWKNYYFNAMDSRHNFFRKYITLNLSMIFAMISTINSYIAPSIYFFVLYASIYQLGFPKSDIAAAVVCLLYLLVFLTGVAGALTGRQWSKNAHYVSAALTFFTVLLLGLVGYNVVAIYLKVANFTLDSSQSNYMTIMIILVLLGINIGCFVFLLLVHLCTHPLQVCSLLVNTPSYTAYTGAYAQTMVIHAFCNVDDVSWGTKGSSSSGVSKFLTDKVYFVSTWIFINSILTFIFIYVDIISRKTDPTRPDLILLAIAIYGSAVILLKTLLAIYHQLKWLFLERCCIGDKDNQQRINTIDRYWNNVFKKWVQSKEDILRQQSMPGHQIKPRFQKK